jgi:pyruvate kinase
VADEMDAAAIVCISRTGFTVRAIARFRPRPKILGFSVDPRTVQQLTVSWGATPLLLHGGESNEEMVAAALASAREAGQLTSGDIVVVLAGESDRSAATDVLRLIQLP